MRIAHVRQRGAPAETPWRLAAALDAGGTTWVDLETARKRAVDASSAARGDALHREPITTLDHHLARGLRVAALSDVLGRFVPRGDPGEDDALTATGGLDFGPPILAPGSFRDFLAFERHVRTTWSRRGRAIPEAWYRLAIFYFQNVSEIRGPGEPVHAPRGSMELDYELEVGALIDTSARDLPPERAEEAIGGYFVLNDWSARDLQRDEATLGFGYAKGKDFATSIGPWLVTPDELADRRAPGAAAPDLAMTATVRTGDGRVIETSRGSWSAAHFSFGALVARASADAHLRPGDLLASGTVGGGCLLEVRDATLGRYLEPGDEVALEIERLGRLATPIIGR